MYIGASFPYNGRQESRKMHAPRLHRRNIRARITQLEMYKISAIFSSADPFVIYNNYTILYVTEQFAELQILTTPNLGYSLCETI